MSGAEAPGVPAEKNAVNESRGVAAVSFDLFQFILNVRPDLRDIHRFDLGARRHLYLGWMLQAGFKEYRALAEHLDQIRELIRSLPPNSFGLSALQYLTWLQRPDVQMAFPLPEKRQQFLIWFYANGLREHFLWDVMTPEEQAPITALPQAERDQFMSMVRRIDSGLSPCSLADNPVFGVNVIGYAYGQLGIGEDGRMAARALLAADIPMVMVDFPPGDDIPKNDFSMASHVVDEAKHYVNLFCMTAEENGRFYAERGKATFTDHYNIGYWPWELSRWPQNWEMLLELVDEVWVSTRHIYDALKPVCHKPLFVMPMAVELGAVREFANRQAARRYFGLAESARLFCFAFDLGSYVDRKNPQACVDAFLEAFPKDRFSSTEVGLVIKVHKPRKRSRAWERLKRLAREDDRIQIIESTLPRSDLLALYAACDCFISLHRAEGFGRGMAEALQLGLHVICTGYSGNVDFCQSPDADWVNYRLVSVRRRQYPHADGQVWAEPDISHAASLMRRFVDHPPERKAPREWPRFSAVEVGMRYRKRLLEIWQETRQLF